MENILQFSRSERGTVRLAPEPRELAPLVRDLVRDFAPLAGREVSFVIHPADDAVAQRWSGWPDIKTTMAVSA